MFCMVLNILTWYALRAFQEKAAAESEDKKKKKIHPSNFTRRYYEVATAKRMSESTTHYNLDLGRAPYVLYGVKYIDLVSLAVFKRRYYEVATARRMS